LKNDEKITAIGDSVATIGGFFMGSTGDGACEGGKLSNG
jgi:hypothetical protein